MEQNLMVAMDVDTASNKEKKIKLKMKHTKKKAMFNFNVYIYKVLNKAHPDIAISAEAMDMVNTILTNMMLKLAEKASKFNKIRHKNLPLAEADISAAVNHLFPKRLAFQALYSAFSALMNESMEEICDEMAKM